MASKQRIDSIRRATKRFVFTRTELTSNKHYADALAVAQLQYLHTSVCLPASTSASSDGLAHKSTHKRAHTCTTDCTDKRALIWPRADWPTGSRQSRHRCRRKVSVHHFSTMKEDDSHIQIYRYTDIHTDAQHSIGREMHGQNGYG